MKRVLFHAINHVGLGHLTRTLTIARWITQRVADIDVLILVEDESELLSHEPFAWIRIPSIYDFKLAGWQKFPSILQEGLVTSVVQGVIGEFQPSVVIYDTVLWEPIWRAVQPSGARQVLVARMGQLTRCLLAEQSKLLTELNAIIVPHDPAEILRDQPLLERFHKQVVYAGPIVRKGLHEIDPKRAAVKYGLSDNRFKIVVTVGGGGWKQTNEFFRIVMTALSVLITDTSHELVQAVIVAGPHYVEAVPDDNRLHTQVTSFEADMLDLMAAANLVVCQAGYNTLNEISEIGVPAICIPVLEADDQVDRAQYFSEQFPNITKSNLAVDDIVGHIRKWQNVSRFRFARPTGPSLRLRRVQETVTKVILDLLDGQVEFRSERRL